MVDDWTCLSDELQIALMREALGRALQEVSGHAEWLADAIEVGLITDRGGAEALRLLARLARAAQEDTVSVPA